MLTLQNISYTPPGKDPLFSSVYFTVNRYEKVALIGNNGSGKSTLLKIIAGELRPSEGYFKVDAVPYSIPQVFGQYNHLSIAQALQIEEKLNALKEILSGNTSQENFNLLNEDWTIEERCKEALHYWKLNGIDLAQKMETLSGGEKTKVFLAGILIHQPQLVLLDEPSNHLDIMGRQLLYDFTQTIKITLIVVSHDRKLLNFLHPVCELSTQGIRMYGGNYDFYEGQKRVEMTALSQDIQSMEKTLRKARKKERETIERQQKLDSRGKGKQEKAGVARIMMNTLRNNAEKSTSKLKHVHTEKIGGITKELKELQSFLPDIDKMKFGFDNSILHAGKILFTATDINFSYGTEYLWRENLNFQIASGERIALKGKNGSGKTTLIKLLLGDSEPQTGSIFRAGSKPVYIDQEYSLIDNQLKVYEQASLYNTASLPEHELKTRLNRFLFTKDLWNTPCNKLSGGERMRLMLCCLTLKSGAQDVILLDEPTNNLDIQNVDILIASINEYEGTLIVVSHDETFLEQINIERTIQL